MAGHDSEGSPPVTRENSEPAPENHHEIRRDEHGDTDVESSPIESLPAPTYLESEPVGSQSPIHQIERAASDSGTTIRESDNPRLATDSPQTMPGWSSSRRHSDPDYTPDVYAASLSSDHSTAEAAPTDQPGSASHENVHDQDEAAYGSPGVSTELATAVSAINMAERSASLSETPDSTAVETAPVQLTQDVSELAISSRPSSSSSRSNLRPDAPAFQPSEARSLISTIASRQAQRRRGVELEEVILPPWQPDSEAASCSYIVRSPGESFTAPTGGMYWGERGIADFSYAQGGGERVRMCNPCVPDPNTTPPQSQPWPAFPPHPYQLPRLGHQRSQSSAGAQAFSYRGASAMQPTPYPTFTSLAGSATTRSRSATMNQVPPPGFTQASRDGQLLSSLFNTDNRFFPSASPAPNATVPGGRTYADSPVLPSTRRLPNRTAGPLRYSEGYDAAAEFFNLASASSNGSNVNRPLPPPPQIPEEDQCPICHHELPSRSLPDFERLREEHITSCVEEHSTFRRTPPAAPQSGGPGTSPARALRPTGMISYIATEKDAASEEECTICLEYFKPGDKMARLECWCRFHYKCITEWFEVGGHGRCPIHQHDSYGY
ncbi:FYVE zinc finger protein [Seiridium cupressi]